MAEARPDNLRGATLTWTGSGLEFSGTTDAAGPDVVVSLDGQTKVGASPMELLLLSLAGCMAIDIRIILERSRVPLDHLSVRVEGDRREKHPMAYERIRLHLDLSGPTDADRGRVERAIRLSEETYCSVHHSLHPSIEIETTYTLV
jgi:putative redox protein